MQDRSGFGKSSKSVQCAITGRCLRMRHRPSAQRTALIRKICHGFRWHVWGSRVVGRGFEVLQAQRPRCRRRQGVRNMGGVSSRLGSLESIVSSPAINGFGKSSQSIQCAMLKACDACAEMGQLQRTVPVHCTDSEDFPQISVLSKRQMMLFVEMFVVN